jgi:hypothetical protein
MAAIETQPAMPSLMPDQPISGFNAFFASLSAKTRGVKGSMRGISNLGGKWAGKTPEEARQLAMEEYAALPDEEKMQWESKASGEQLKPGGAMPFPSVSTGRMSKTLVSGESPTAASRKAAMDGTAAANAAAAKAAVTARKAQQDANPAAVVDMNIAAKNENLAKSGITDMGGGTKAMSNQYGTGFAETLTKEQFAARKPGVIRDEKGTVDMAALKKGKLAYDPTEMGAGAIAYGSPTAGTPALNMDAGDELRKSIASKVMAAAPGAAERLAADRARMISAMPPPKVAQAAQKPAPAMDRNAAAASAVMPFMPMVTDAMRKKLPQ